VIVQIAEDVGGVGGEVDVKGGVGAEATVRWRRGRGGGMGVGRCGIGGE